MMGTDEAAFNKQVGWTPREILVDGHEFEVQLAPMWVDAQADWCRERGLPAEYFQKCDKFECDDEYDEGYDLREFINVYFHGSEETVRITIKKNQPDVLRTMFPNAIDLPSGKYSENHGYETPGRIEWDNGVKHSLRSVDKVKTKYYDFVQKVMRRRAACSVANDGSKGVPDSGSAAVASNGTCGAAGSGMAANAGSGGNEFLDSAEAGVLLGVCSHTILSWNKRDWLKSCGKRPKSKGFLFRRSDVEAYGRERRKLAKK